VGKTNGGNKRVVAVSNTSNDERVDGEDEAGLGSSLVERRTDEVLDNCCNSSIEWTKGPGFYRRSAQV
jgi:hypothetical protein